MSAPAWSLTFGSSSRSLAAWGVTGVARSRRSQAADVVGFDLALPRSLDAEVPWSVGAEIAIARDGVGWFRGRVTSMSRAATGSEEIISVKLAGPWWYLDQLVYQQVWTVYGSGAQVKKSHALLNTWADGSRMGVRAQINDALEWARSRAATAYGADPFIWDQASFPDLEIPADEVRDITVAEVIAKQLRWIPDAVTWFDYSTNPPTFRVARRASLTTRRITVPGANVAAISVTPRADLVVPAVVCKFERTDTIDGVAIPGLAVDLAPAGATGEEFGALCLTIDLEGASLSFATAYVGTSAFPAIANKAGWWEWLKLRESVLQRTDTFVLDEVLEVSRQPTSGEAEVLPRELVEGQIPEWMDARSQAETVRVKAKIRVYSAGQLVETVTKEYSVNVVATDAQTGTFRQVASASSGEAVPYGLAQVLFDALSVLEYEGSLSRVLSDLPAAADEISIGHRLSIDGLRPEWASMAAMVQEVSEDLDSGTVTLRFGPPQHLGGRDLVELLRVNRFRFVYTSPAARSGQAPASGGVGLGRTTPKENSGSGSLQREKLVLRAGGGTVELDASMAGNLVVSLREVSVCVDGVEKKMLLLCSQPY